jgi:hypothetical protein
MPQKEKKRKKEKKNYHLQTEINILGKSNTSEVTEIMFKLKINFV